MYDHTFLNLQINRSDIRPHIKWAVSLVIAYATLMFLRGLYGYVRVNILTLSLMRHSSMISVAVIYYEHLTLYCSNRGSCEYTPSAWRQEGLTGYCFKYIDRPFCLWTEYIWFNEYSCHLRGYLCIFQMRRKRFNAHAPAAHCSKPT